MNDRLAKQNKQKVMYKALFQEVSAILFRCDPIGINFEDNTDEYDPEARTILPRLGEAQAESDVLEIVYQEFVRWFGEDIASPKEKYAQIAKEVYETWLRSRRELQS